MIIRVGFEQDDAAVRWHGVEKDGEARPYLMRVSVSYGPPNNAIGFGTFGRVGDEDRIIVHFTILGDAEVNVTERCSNRPSRLQADRRPPSSRKKK